MNGYRKSRSTTTKDDHFKQILNTHIKISKACINKHQWAGRNYYYYDLNAGMGVDKEGRIGSPLLFQRTADKYQLQYIAKYFEIKPKYCDILKQYVDNDSVICGDHHITFPQFFGLNGKTNYGLVYSDESGHIPPFELIAECFSHSGFSMVDLLIYVSSANLKRALKAHNNHKRLIDYINIINKKVWIVREPQAKHQWTFLLGTNWTNYPAFEKLGFYNINSTEGINIMYKLNYTNKERKIHDD